MKRIASTSLHYYCCLLLIRWFSTRTESSSGSRKRSCARLTASLKPTTPPLKSFKTNVTRQTASSGRKLEICNSATFVSELFRKFCTHRIEIW